MPDTAVTDDSTHVSASFWTSNVRQQVIAQVTSGGKPTAGTEGRVIANTTDNRLELDDGAAFHELLRWTGSNTWTPTIAQGVSTNIGKTITEAQYVLIGNVCVFWFSLAVTANGTAGSQVTVTIPLAPSGHGGSQIFGMAEVNDASVQIYICSMLNAGSTNIRFRCNALGLFGVSPNVALASGDNLQAVGAYLWA